MAHPKFYYQCSLLFSLFYAKMVAMNIVNINENFNSYFSADLKTIFKQCSDVASKSGFRLFLIGGMVRDLLLNRKNLDIDITVEGDAIAFSHILEQELGVKITSVHKDFGTVKVKFDGQNIDFASTRCESYPQKGHLPGVNEIGCPLEKDVLRRDFSVNSLALSLNQDSFADLIDYVGGYEDLKAKIIRVLHDKSFIDDPTRIIRALRYSQKLGFEFDEKTLKLQQEYLGNINYDMSFSRVKNEIKRTFELNLQCVFDNFIDQKIYKLITLKEIEKPKTNIESLINQYKPKTPWFVYFGIIVVQEDEEFSDIIDLTKTQKDTVLDAKNLLSAKLKNDFEIYKAFQGKSIETLLILAASGKDKEVSRYLDNLNKIKIMINGDDLIGLGFAPSKAFNEAFDYVLKHKLKNPQMEKTEELILAKECLTK